VGEREADELSEVREVGEVLVELKGEAACEELCRVEGVRRE
jgi:hypothetical protein